MKKKILAIILMVLVVLSLGACKRNKNKQNTPPEIIGAVDKTIEKGSAYVPLEGVTAYDKEDGDLTDKIEVVLGRFNKNVVGTYPITYTVTDSQGETTSVTINITVEAGDKEGPMLTGVQDKTIIVGDTSFSLTGGVAASDTHDGDVTNKIVVKGTVDPWTVGEYEVEYSVSDNSNNETKVTRKITVSLDQFIFGEVQDKEFALEEGKYQFSLDIPTYNTLITSYALIKLEFKVNATAACDLAPTIDNGTGPAKISLSEGDNEVIVYFRVTAPKEGAILVLNPSNDATLTFSDVKVSRGESSDTTAPEIKVPTDAVVLPGNITDKTALASFVLIGVSAFDNVDGTITSKLTVDFGDLDVGNYIGDTEVAIKVTDKSGNVGEAKRSVTFAKSYDTHFIADPSFDTDYDHRIWGLHDGAGDPEMYVENGVLIHHNRSNQFPGYDSASCPTLKATTEIFEPYNWYLLSFKAKVAVERDMRIRIGMAAPGPVWIENFPGADNTQLHVTTEWQQFYVLFYIHEAVSEGSGSNVIAMELKNGSAFDYNTKKEIGNTFYFDDLQFYLITNENSAPKFKLVSGLPTTFAAGVEKPDLTKYVIAHDREDAVDITITEANITESIDMNKEGEYDVVYKATDSEGLEGTYTLVIKVRLEADTTPPVIEEAPNLVKEYDQFSKIPDITKFVGAYDDVDGKITITENMIETDANINVAGTYDIVYTVSDSSGNVATHTVTVTVRDKEAPKIEGRQSISVDQGERLTANEILGMLKVTDNVDGDMTLNASNISGLDDVDFDSVDEYEITISATDAAGNEAEFKMTINVRFDATKPIANDDVVIDLAPTTLTVNPVSCEVTKDEDEYKVILDSVGGYASANHIKLTGLKLTKGNTYALKFVAKADQARKVKFGIGVGLYDAPWFDYYDILENGDTTLLLSDQYTEYVIFFNCNKNSQGSGPTIEFDLGNIGHEGDVSGNNVYFKDFAIYSTTQVINDKTLELHNYLEDNLDATGASVEKKFDVVKITPTNVGVVATDAKITSTDVPVENGKTYELVIVAKADQARQIKVNVGNSPLSSVYTLEKVGSDTLLLGTEYAKYKVRFTVDVAVSNPTLELCYGNTGHAGDVNDNAIYIKKCKLFRVDGPTIVLVDSNTYILGNGYYNSTDPNNYNVMITSNETAKQFVGTIIFTKDTLPAGSIIEIASGYQYRPEGWTNNSVQPSASRPANVKTAQVVVTEEWWGNYTRRAFNISKDPMANLLGDDYDAAVNAFKIYVPIGTEVKNTPFPRDINMLTEAEITQNAYEYRQDLEIAKVGGDEWEWFASKVTADFTGYTKLVITVKGTADETIMVKLNNQSAAEVAPTITMTGVEKTVEIDIPNEFEWNAESQTVVLLPNAGTKNGTGNYFVISQLELQGAGKETIDLLAGTLSHSTYCKVGKALTINKPEEVTSPYASALLDVDRDITQYSAVRYVVQGKAGEKVKFIVNSQENIGVEITLNGEIQKGVINLTDKSLADGNGRKTITLYVNPDGAGTGNSVTFYELEVLVDLPAPEYNPNPTPKEGVEANEVKTTGTAQSSNYATWNDAHTIATLSNLRNNLEGGSQWGRWDFNPVTDEGYVKVTVVLHVTPGLKVMAKIDSKNTPGNNSYDSMEGNKQTKVADESGVLTFIWDLEYFAYKAKKINPSYALTNIEKFVFFACDGTGNAEVMESATVELISITFE